MKNIVTNTLKKVNKNFTLDEIKKAVSEECKKATFEVTAYDWYEILTEVLYELA